VLRRTASGSRPFRILQQMAPPVDILPIRPHLLLLHRRLRVR
jgi:hypothetical protein